MALVSLLLLLVVGCGAFTSDGDRGERGVELGVGSGSILCSQVGK